MAPSTGVPSASVFTGGVQPDAIIPVRTGGNADLQEESSDTKTIGIVFTPSFVEGLAVTARPQACNYCGVCEEVCPVEAIALPYLILMQPEG